MPTMTERDVRGWKMELQLAKRSLKNFHEQCKANVSRFFDPQDSDLKIHKQAKAENPGEWSEPALVTRYIQTKLAHLYLNEPEFSLNPAEPMYASEDGGRDPEVMARIFTAGLNYFYRSTDQAGEDSDVITHCLLSGIGMKLHGYHTSFVHEPRLDESQWEFGYAIGSKTHFHVVAIGPDGKGQTTKDDGHLHKVVRGMFMPGRATGQKKEHDHVFDLAPSREEQEVIISLFRHLEFGDSPWEYDERVRKQSPWGKALWILRALWDPRGKKQAEWDWFEYDEWRQLEDVKNFPLFKNTDELQTAYHYLGTGHHAGELIDIDDKNTGEAPRPDWKDDEEGDYNSGYLKHIRLRYLFIKRDIVRPGHANRNNKILVFADGFDKPLYYDDNPFDLVGYPIAILKWLPAPNTFQTISDVTVWQDVFEDYLHFRRCILRKTDRMKDVIFVNEGLLPDEKSDLTERYASAEDGELITFNAPNVTDIRQVIMPVVNRPVDPDLYRAKADTRQEMRELSGESEIGMGQPMSKRTTATEIMKFEESRAKLLSIEQAGITKYAKRSGEIYVSFLQQFFTGRVMVEIVNSLGEREIRPFTRHEAQTRCRLDVVAESTVPMDKQFRRWELTNLLQQIAQFPFLVRLIQQEGWIEYLKQLFETYRLPLVGKILRPIDPAVWAGSVDQFQGAGGQQPGLGGMATGGEEAGALAGNREPFTQGIETRAPMPGHISGQGARL